DWMNRAMRRLVIHSMRWTSTPSGSPWTSGYSVETGVRCGGSEGRIESERLLPEEIWAGAAGAMEMPRATVVGRTAAASEVRRRCGERDAVSRMGSVLVCCSRMWGAGGDGGRK